MRVGHAHGFGGFENGGIDAGEADVGVAKNGQQGVKDERDDGGAAADAADERDGNEKAEEREAGNGLKNVGDAESDGSAKGRALHDEHAERDRDGDGDEHGDQDERRRDQRGARKFRSDARRKMSRDSCGDSRCGLQRSGDGFDFGMLDAQKILERAASATMRPFSSSTMREASRSGFTEIMGDKDDGFSEAAGEYRKIRAATRRA